MDGTGMFQMKTGPGIEATEQILSMRDSIISKIQAEDPSITSEELAAKEMQMQIRHGMKSALTGIDRGSRLSVEAFWWYWQAGYKERWNQKEWGDNTLPRDFDAYFDEALAAGWWDGVAGPTPDQEPRVLVECGGNMLRRTRGGKKMLLEHLWPKLKLIVSIDFRINSTGLFSDVLLPAAQHYEKLAYHIPTPHQMMMTFSDKAAEPAGEAKAEWVIFQLLLKKFEERAKARGIESYQTRDGLTVNTQDLWHRYTHGGNIVTEEQVADEIARDAAYVGVVADGTTLDTMREQGHVRITGWGMSMFSLAQASPVEKDRTHTPFRNHVELGDPYPTYSRRAQFYIDHPWWLEAGEELPVYKPNPKAGGDHPLRMTSGHNRWSIHSMNAANRVLLQTHRGEPAVEINPDDAAARGVEDNDPIRIWNDISSFVSRAKIVQGVMPGQIISYNGWDPQQYRGSEGANEIEAGMVKWIAFAGGYGHINYTMAEWQPIPTDRGVPCDFEKAELP